MREVAEQTVTDSSTIRPFRVNVPQTKLDELQNRIKATNWPERETVTDESHGVRHFLGIPIGFGSQEEAHYA